MRVVRIAGQAAVGFPRLGAGRENQILAYMADTDQLAVAAYIYGAVGIGVQFPDSAMSQFEARKPWKPVDPTNKSKGANYFRGEGESCAATLSLGGLILSVSSGISPR